MVVNHLFMGVLATSVLAQKQYPEEEKCAYNKRVGTIQSDNNNKERVHFQNYNPAIIYRMFQGLHSTPCPVLCILKLQT
jgi:hypothetical protein